MAFTIHKGFQGSQPIYNLISGIRQRLNTALSSLNFSVDANNATLLSQSLIERLKSLRIYKEVERSLDILIDSPYGYFLISDRSQVITLSPFLTDTPRLSALMKIVQSRIADDLKTLNFAYTRLR